MWHAWWESWQQNGLRNAVYGVYAIVLLGLLAMGLVAADAAIADCQVSRLVQQRMQAQLSKTEWASVRPEFGWCPLFFSYQRDDGASACVHGSANFLRGAEIGWGSCG